MFFKSWHVCCIVMRATFLKDKGEIMKHYSYGLLMVLAFASLLFGLNRTSDAMDVDGAWYDLQPIVQQYHAKNSELKDTAHAIYPDELKAKQNKHKTQSKQQGQKQQLHYERFRFNFFKL